ncbi:oxidoreductase-like domain-containing protein [Pseudoduganella sp. HUAS MS19]
MAAQDDPQPQPPAEPGPDDCCHSGCTWCVLDLYYEDLERYRSALAAWEARRKKVGVSSGNRTKVSQSS